MALGIPGDAITAVMLATLTLHGITPGPKLVEDNPTLIATIFAGFFVINLLLLPLGMLLSRVAAPILRVREAFMMTAIVILCAVGIYFVRGNPFDLLVMGGGRCGWFPAASSGCADGTAGDWHGAWANARADVAPRVDPDRWQLPGILHRTSHCPCSGARSVGCTQPTVYPCHAKRAS